MPSFTSIIMAPSHIAAVIAAFMLIGSGFAPAMAAGDDDAPSSPKCKTGYVYSSSKSKCVQKTSELLSDDDLYKEAVAHAKSGSYDEALDLLWRIKDQKSARVLNYLGYSTRKKGDLEKGISYYKQALEIDPDYVLTREYLGEGYLQKGDVASAKVQLKEIGERCGTDCVEYQELALMIKGHKLTW